MTSNDLLQEFKNWKFSKYKITNLLIGLSALLIYELAARPFYRPYIYKNNIADFHIADTIGNTLGTFAAIFIMIFIFSSEFRKGMEILFLVAISVVFYEIAHPLLGKPIDIWDIIATILSSILAWAIFKMLFKNQASNNREI